MVNDELHVENVRVGQFASMIEFVQHVKSVGGVKFVSIIIFDQHVEIVKGVRSANMDDLDPYVEIVAEEHFVTMIVSEDDVEFAIPMVT